MNTIKGNCDLFFSSIFFLLLRYSNGSYLSPLWRYKVPVKTKERRRGGNKYKEQNLHTFISNTRWKEKKSTQLHQQMITPIQATTVGFTRRQRNGHPSFHTFHVFFEWFDGGNFSTQSLWRSRPFPHLFPCL